LPENILILGGLKKFKPSQVFEKSWVLLTLIAGGARLSIHFPLPENILILGGLKSFDPFSSVRKIVGFADIVRRGGTSVNTFSLSGKYIDFGEP